MSRNDLDGDQIRMDDVSPEYAAFIEKFKPKKTTDDCYTPEPIYNAIAGYVAEHYGLDPATFVRPFYPGMDFERFPYEDGAVVVDNPPFSILSRIVGFYNRRKIKYFLFAPALTITHYAGRDGQTTILPIGVDITYENGANISTSFVTNLEPENALRCDHALHDLIKRKNAEVQAKFVKQLPKYSYPPYVTSSAMAQIISTHGADWTLKAKDCVYIASLDAQNPMKKAIFGGGLLLSEKAAAEKTAAEKTAAEKTAAEKTAAEKTAAEKTRQWHLSERELEIIKRLGK